MSDMQKPNLHGMDHSILARLTNDLWDENARLREANEQLRLDNKDLSRLLRDCNTKGAT